jgi:hypothetical protein
LIIWPRTWSKPQEERAAGDNLDPLWQFISRRYHVVHVFAAFDDPTISNNIYYDIYEVND